MLISNLPPGLKELAEKRMFNVRMFCDVSHPLIQAFYWKASPEGLDFWERINNGDFSVYYGCKVTNCKPKALRLEVGKTYLARNGKEVLIDIYGTGFRKTPFGSSQGFQSYRLDGRYLPAGSDHEFDLIKEVK